MSEPARSRAILYRAIASALSITLFLGIAEAGFRIAGLKGEFPAPRSDVVIPGPQGITERLPYAFVPFATIRSRYDGDPRGYFDDGGTIDHVHNSAGWRDLERTAEKPEGTFRILGLGDSYLFGQGVRRAEVCLAQLEALLQAQSPGVRIEAINTGMNGYNTAMERGLLVNRGLAYDPDLILVHFVLNDVERAPWEPSEGPPKVDFFQEYSNVYQTPDALSSYSYLWSWARQRYLQRVEGGRYLQEMLDSFLADDGRWSYVTEALLGIDRAARDAGVPWALVIFPFLHQLDGDYPFQPVHDRLREFAGEHGIAVLDLRAAFRSYRGPELWVHPTDQHPNEIAHRLAAEAIRSFLTANPVRFRIPAASPALGSPQPG